MKRIIIFAKNREHAEKVARNKYGERYFIISIKPILKKNFFGILKKEYRVSIGVLEQN